MHWVIGDIHGMLRPLEALLDAIRRDDPCPELFFVGDYVNRGPDSSRVLDLLLTLPDGRFVRGNHDDVFDLILHGKCYHPHPDARTPVAGFLWFVQHGLWNTLTSYGVDWLDVERVIRRPSEAALARLLEPVPPAHRTFIRTLPPVVEMDGFFVAHAWWDPNLPDDRPSVAARLLTDAHCRRQVLWGRYTEELTRPKRWRRTGYFGHTPVENYPASVRPDDNVPILGPKIVLLDTGAALSFGGRLSAVCADDGRVIQVDRLGEPVSR
jgi:hypothetical protein